MGDCVGIIGIGKHWSWFCGSAMWLWLGWVMEGCVGMNICLVGNEGGVVWWEVLGFVEVCKWIGVLESGGSGLLVVNGMCIALLRY